MNKAVPSKKDEPRRMAGARGGNESTLLIGNDRRCASENADVVMNRFVHLNNNLNNKQWMHDHVQLTQLLNCQLLELVPTLD